MKKQFLTISLLLISTLTFACSCDWSGNFLQVAKHSELIVKAKVIEHVYHTEDGNRFTNEKEFLQAKIDNNYNKFYGTGESIRIEVIELIKGTEKRKIIEIFDTDGADCRDSVNRFETEEIYIFSIYQPHRTEPKLPNETNSDYAIGGCAENTLKYYSETNEVFGMINGKSYRKKARKYSYDKLIKKIT